MLMSRLAVPLWLLTIASAGTSKCFNGIHCGGDEPIEIILDSDTAMTAFQQKPILHPTDIDDDLAFIMAISMQRNHRLKLKAAIATFGNANSSATITDMRALATQVGYRGIVARGGEFGDPLTKWSSGSAVLHELLMKPLRPFSRPPVVVSIGSMYTLASAVTRDERLLPKIGGLLMLGGSINNGHYIEKNLEGDLNFKADKEATNVVLGLPMPKVLMTMDLCMQVLFTAVELQKLSSSRCNGSVIATHLPRVTSWLAHMGHAEALAFKNWPQYGNASTPQGTVTVGTGAIPWDPIAMSYLSNPEWFGDEKCFQMQLSLGNKAIKSQEVPCSQCEANGWVYCVIAPTQIVNATALLDNLVDRLCEV